VYTISREVWLPKPRDEVFEFFSDARNLQVLTPKWLDFKVVTEGEIELKPGALIDYKLRVRFLPIRWTTEIVAFDPPHSFIDNQAKGPYKRWYHTHTFEEEDGGTLCRDHVEYAVPGGALAHWLFVKRDVKRIFDYRREKLVEMFGADTRTQFSNKKPAE